MNKKQVEEYLPRAYDVLKECGIASGTPLAIENEFRGYIASFGAAVSMGSLLSAVAFFSKQGDAKRDRSKLMEAIYRLIAADGGTTEIPKADALSRGHLFQYVRDRNKNEADQRAVKEDVLSAAVALKLAMNLYDLKNSDGEGKQSDQPEN